MFHCYYVAYRNVFSEISGVEMFTQELPMVDFPTGHISLTRIL